MQKELNLKHVPYPFDEAANKLILFLEKRNFKNIDKCIDKINDLNQDNLLFSVWEIAV